MRSPARTFQHGLPVAGAVADVACDADGARRLGLVVLGERGAADLQRGVLVDGLDS
jgi:hypothetical protein